MAIDQKTTIQGYQLKKGGVRARMAIFRMIAADSVNNQNASTRLQPGDWKGARKYTMASYSAAYCSGLSAGFDDKNPIWYSHQGPNFRDEKFAHECEGGPDHRGYYTNEDGETCRDGSGLARGIVGRLTHGRFIAGYWWGDNGERVYFPEVFTDERDAARAADSRAERFAETCREDSERFNRMQRAEISVDDAIEELTDCIALRKTGRRDSDDVREAIEKLREARETLETATREYEGV